MTTPTPEQRLAFAHGITLLLLKHVKMTAKDKAYVESVRDAQTPEQMLECWRDVPTSASVAAYVAAYASVSGRASAYEWVIWACEQAIKVGVPEAEVKALRALTLGAKND